MIAQKSWLVCQHGPSQRGWLAIYRTFDVHGHRNLSQENDHDGVQAAAATNVSNTTSRGAHDQTRVSADIKLKVKKASFDYDSVKTDRNFITPLRAMTNYHLFNEHLEDLPIYYRRNASTTQDTPMKVYRTQDVEKRAIEVHGSKEVVDKLERNRYELQKFTQNNIFQVNHYRRKLMQFVQEQEDKTHDSAKRKEEAHIAHRSLEVVRVAVGVNALNAVCKFGAYCLTGSSSMFAEAIHSLADTANQCILLFGKIKSFNTPNPAHPYGYKNFQNVTALVSGVGVFCLGSGLSIYHGVHVLIHPVEITNMYWSYVILSIALITEGATLKLAYTQLSDSARKQGVSLWSYLRSSRDPTVNVIFWEDAAAVAGIFMAGGCMGLASLTGQVYWDAIGSLGVGALLALVSGHIINTNAQILIGQSIPEPSLKEMQRVLERDRMVRGLHDVKATDMGEGHVRFKAEADFDGKEVTSAYLNRKVDMQQLLNDVADIKDIKQLEQFMLTHGEGVVDQLGEEVDRLEKKLRKKHPDVRHVDLEVL